MSRREFLGSAVAAALPIQPPSVRHWLVHSGGDTPMLRESARGFESALPKHLAALDSALVIFPATLESPDVPPLIRAHLRRGATVIIESGAAFHNHVEYPSYRRWMREQLGITVGAPLDLWADRTRGVPYIEYEWPIRTAVRDFSRVVPVADQPGDVIAWAGDTAVALKRRIGNGTLIFLGSPLGPVLRAGDREARRWLQHVFAG